MKTGVMNDYYAGRHACSAACYSGHTVLLHMELHGWVCQAISDLLLLVPRKQSYMSTFARMYAQQAAYHKNTGYDQ